MTDWYMAGFSFTSGAITAILIFILASLLATFIVGIILGATGKIK